ncbi:hypothetical protein HB912_08645, partial [Listeria aquatica]
AGQKVELVAYDAAKPNTRKELDRKSFTVREVAGSNLQGKILDAHYDYQTAKVVGNFTGDIQVAYITVNGGEAQAWGGSFNEDGTFEYWTKSINHGDRVTIYGYNKTTAHVELDRYTFIAA